MSKSIRYVSLYVLFFSSTALASACEQSQNYVCQIKSAEIKSDPSATTFGSRPAQQLFIANNPAQYPGIAEGYTEVAKGSRWILLLSFAVAFGVMFTIYYKRYTKMGGRHKFD